MNLSKFGIKDTPLLKKAFEYALAKHQSLTKQTIELTAEQIDSGITNQLNLVLADKSKSESEKNKFKQDVEAIKKRETQAMTMQVTNNRNMEFDANVKNNIDGLKNIGVNDNRATATALLLNTVKSPKDLMKLQEVFDAEICADIAEYLDFETYPAEKKNNLATSSDVVKNISLMVVTTRLSGLANLINSGQQIQLMPNFGQQLAGMLDTAKLLRGFNPKADADLINKFNSVERISGFKLSVNDQDEIEIAITAKPQQQRPGPGGMMPQPPAPKTDDGGFGKF